MHTPNISHKPCIGKLRIPVTDNTFLCPWCTPATLLEQQPTHRHTDSDNEEGDDQQEKINQKYTAASEQSQQPQQTTNTRTSGKRKRNAQNPTKSYQTTSPKHKSAENIRLKCTYCKKAIGQKLAFQCLTKKCENRIHCQCKDAWAAKTRIDPTHHYKCPHCTKASTTKITKKNKQRQTSPSPPSDPPPYTLHMCCLPATSTERR